MFTRWGYLRFCETLGLLRGARNTTMASEGETE